MRSNKRNNGTKRNKRKGNTPNVPQAMKTFYAGNRITMPLVSCKLTKAINTYYIVYAVYNASASTPLYSFVGSTGQISPTLYQDILSDALNSAEFTVYKGQYNLYRITGVTLKISQCTVMPTQLADVPPLYFDLTVGSNVSYTTSMAAKSDSAIQVKANNNTGSSRIINYNFPPHLTGISGYTIGGTSSWMPTNAAYSNGLLYLILGYLSAPDFNSAVTSASYKLANVEVLFKIDFASPAYTV